MGTDSLDAWASSSFTFSFAGQRGRDFVFLCTDRKGREKIILCSPDGAPRETVGWHLFGMTEAQRKAFKRALGLFVLACEAPELMAERAKIAEERMRMHRGSFLASANALLRGGMPAAEVRALLDEYLVEHVMGS